MASELAEKMAGAVQAVAPLLREAGFRKQRHAFNREAEPGLTQVLTFQMGAHQPPGTHEIEGLRENLYGAFTINLGLHIAEVDHVGNSLPRPRPSFLRAEDMPKPKPPPKFFREGHCQVTKRIGQLFPDPADRWWRLDLPDGELAELVRKLIREYALPFFDHLGSRRALLDAWHAGDPAVRYTPKFTIAIVHAKRGENQIAEKLLTAELDETDHPAVAESIIAAASELGLRVQRQGP
jgi:Domain of unknown function (DUF4304)